VDNQATYGSQIFGSDANTLIRYCDIKDCYIGSTWDANLGVDGGAI